MPRSVQQRTGRLGEAQAIPEMQTLEFSGQLTLNTCSYGKEEGSTPVDSNSPANFQMSLIQLSMWTNLLRDGARR